jgi:Mn2+/Fe2+ NRAMP family transporter
MSRRRRPVGLVIMLVVGLFIAGFGVYVSYDEIYARPNREADDIYQLGLAACSTPAECAQVTRPEPEPETGDVIFALAIVAVGLAVTIIAVLKLRQSMVDPGGQGTAAS